MMTCPVLYLYWRENFIKGLWSYTVKNEINGDVKKRRKHASTQEDLGAISKVSSFTEMSILYWRWNHAILFSCVFKRHHLCTFTIDQ